MLIVASALLFHRLGDGSLEGDEAIHGEVARNAARGPWLPLRSGANLYLGKPPLKILAEAAVFRGFGESAFNARVIDAAAGVATLLAAFLFALRLGGPAAATLAALLPLTARSWVFLHNVRSGTQDAAFGLLLLLALFAWFVYVESGRRRRWLVASALLAGLAMLVKGPPGLLLLPTLLAYEAALWRLGDPATPPRPAAPWSHLALSLVLPLVYAAYLVSWVGGQGLLERLRQDVLVRTTSGLDPGHLHGPLYYFGRLGFDWAWWLLLLVPVLLLLAGRLPPAVDAPRAPAARRAAILLALWAAVVLVCLSLSASKLPWYAFPAYPALALLAAAGATALLRRVPRRLAAIAAVLLAVALAAGLRATWTRTSVERPLSVPHRLALAIRDTGHYRFVVKQEVVLHGSALFYLGGLGPTMRRVPPEVWGDPATCGFVLRHAPLGDHDGDEIDPRELRLPSSWAGGGTPLWLIDVDRCLPPYVVTATPG